MFVDASAIVAILLSESDAHALSATLEAASRCLTSSAVRLETCMVLAGRRDVSPSRAQHYFDGLASQIGLIEVPIDEQVGRTAVERFERYGKGRHPAQLNFGDCLSYACAKAHGARLLFKGDDFAQTDVNAQQARHLGRLTRSRVSVSV
jgi:ribonuclease VapC